MSYCCEMSFHYLTNQVEDVHDDIFCCKQCKDKNCWNTVLKKHKSYFCYCFLAVCPSVCLAVSEARLFTGCLVDYFAGCLCHPAAWQFGFGSQLKVAVRMKNGFQRRWQRWRISGPLVRAMLIKPKHITFFYHFLNKSIKVKWNLWYFHLYLKKCHRKYIFESKLGKKLAK